METELKLRIAPETAAALRRHPLLARLQLRRPWTRQVENRYFDTPDLALGQAGLELRLRRDGPRILQALKAPLAHHGGLHRRQEWEAPLRADVLDLEALLGWLPHGALAPPTMDALLAAVRSDALAPRVVTRYRRTTWQLQTEDGALIELALDVGMIGVAPAGSDRPGRSDRPTRSAPSTGRRTPSTRELPLAEIELELKGGPESALFGLAMALQADLPMHPETRGKAERGFALLTSSTPEPRRARAVPLDATMGVAQALRACAEECLAQVQANALGAADSAEPEFIHQLRVGLRRLRSVLDLFKDFAPPPPALLEDLRWASQALGSARDLQVLAAETLALVAPADPSAADLDWTALRAGAQAAAEQARRDAVQGLQSPRQAAWQLSLMGWLSNLRTEGDASAEEPLQDYAARRLRRLRKRLLQRGQDLPHDEPAARHRVRIAAKKLRYAAEVLAEAAPGFADGPALRALASLQQCLGELNDAEVAVRLLAAPQPTAASATAAAYARGWLAADSAHRAAQLGGLWKRLARRLKRLKRRTRRARGA